MAIPATTNGIGDAPADIRLPKIGNKGKIVKVGKSKDSPVS